jgi:hypothetical protein
MNGEPYQPRTTDDALRIARSIAIEQYARLEDALCIILANLLGIRHDDAAVIFYATTNADARNRIIKTFIGRRHGDTYSKYFQGSNGENKTEKLPGMWNFISKLDTKRNFIVHWVPAGNVSFNIGTGESRAWDDYRPAYWQTRLTELDPIEKPDLNEFIDNAEFVTKSLEVFGRLIAPKVTLDAATQQAWLPVFQSPPIYPPPEGHPVQPLLIRR